MHLPTILALTGPIGSTAFDDMLRLIGIAAIVFAFFKGIRSLIVKPAPPAAPQQSVSIPVATPAAVKPAEPAPMAAPQRAAAPAVADNEIAPEILAVIAAAVACAAGPSYRVVSIKRQSSTWEKVGRQSVLSSHKIR